MMRSSEQSVTGMASKNLTGFELPPGQTKLLLPPLFSINTCLIDSKSGILPDPGSRLSYILPQNRLEVQKQ